MRLDARKFVEEETQFHLGRLLTEQSHPITAELSSVAREDPAAGLRLLYRVDRDIPAMLRRPEIVEAARQLAGQMAETLARGRRIFFTGCGATGRLAILLDAMWRRFWRERKVDGWSLEDRVVSVMAGGDYALIKAVEGYEDYAAFGERQITDAGLTAGDLVCAVTEGGETSFVIGTVWAGVRAGAEVWFIYSNPDEALADIQRSQAVIEDDRISKACLATGPMAVSGSTRMQAATAELAFIGSAMEVALVDVLARRMGRDRASASGADPGAIESMANRLAALIDALECHANVATATRLGMIEKHAYERGGLVTYLADRYALDLLTDTTERSPTFLVPPFVKWDEDALPSWSYLVMPCEDSAAAWRRLLQRGFNDVTWSREEVVAMAAPRVPAAMPRLDREEIVRFDISLRGADGRLRDKRDVTVFFEVGGRPGGDPGLHAVERLSGQACECGSRTVSVRFGQATQLAARPLAGAEELSLIVPSWPGLLDLGEHLAVKLVMNAVSSLTMTLMGRVLGNCMIWMSPSNKKLYDRATRYVAQLTGRPYPEACDALFGVMEHVQQHDAGGAQGVAPVLMAVLTLLEGVPVAKAGNML